VASKIEDAAMRPQRFFAWLVILLLASAMLDDAVAAATVGTEDDVLAAENNLYLHFAPLCPQQLSGKTGLPLPGAPDVASINFSASVAVRGQSAPAEPVALDGPPLLYLLMSLQC
jgi:hypothetical protein